MDNFFHVNWQPGCPIVNRIQCVANVWFSRVYGSFYPFDYAKHCGSRQAFICIGNRRIADIRCHDFLIGGLFVRMITKLKLGVVELEKASVEQWGGIDIAEHFPLGEQHAV